MPDDDYTALPTGRPHDPDYWLEYVPKPGARHDEVRALLADVLAFLEQRHVFENDTKAISLAVRCREVLARP